MSSKSVAGDFKLSDYQAIAEFRYQIRRFIRFSEEAASQAGLEPQQHQLLLAVKGMPNGRKARIADLADRLQIQHHSAVELVSRLVTKELVEKVPSETDRREVYVRLTAQGERLLRVLTLHHRDELRRTAPALVGALRELTRKSAARRALPAARMPRRQNLVRGKVQPR
jgi:DNA-binding MarR family transcriptional regulator